MSVCCCMYNVDGNYKGSTGIPALGGESHRGITWAVKFLCIPSVIMCNFNTKSLVEPYLGARLPSTAEVIKSKLVYLLASDGRSASRTQPQHPPTPAAYAAQSPGPAPTRPPDPLLFPPPLPFPNALPLPFHRLKPLTNPHSLPLAFLAALLPALLPPALPDLFRLSLRRVQRPQPIPRRPHLKPQGASTLWLRTAWATDRGCWRRMPPWAGGGK
ncbi:hypothetical protein BDK51DRAFT_39066 [Blyttiomyces helicus]|uniref:Uncharacterized protein n=1 Tax=Blyttiomyces helicus TaxID=388810 RepID=A0A4P9W6A0_9FUNG|nr:hypothetical protein BDK51DRAFT_39066 [Blyttiomyces helicus]|eukprot:RKO87979.1 hypothetical protein BDK51DRAFT_39066 [Blyttiomyces helicus]